MQNSTYGDLKTMGSDNSFDLTQRLLRERIVLAEQSGDACALLLRELHGTLALASLCPDLTARLVELRVHSLFQIFDSVPAALERLVGAGSDLALLHAA